MQQRKNSQPIRKPNAAMRVIDAITTAFAGAQATRRKAHKPVARMVCSPPQVIAGWNASVAAQSDRLARIANRTRDHRLTRALKPTGQYPKFPAERVHKQHKHPLRDENGAYTLVGKDTRGYEYVEGIAVGMSGAPRRMWLAGISAQRGF